MIAAFENGGLLNSTMISPTQGFDVQGPVIFMVGWREDTIHCGNEVERSVLTVTRTSVGPCLSCRVCKYHR